MKLSIRMKRFLARAVAVGLGAFVVVVAANFVGPDWYQDLLRRLQPASRSAPPPTVVARSLPIGPPVSITPMRPEGNDSSISKVPSPLILVRTQRGRNNREGLAQIGVRADSPQTYTAGALLANGARLAEIYDHYVVLEHNGHSVRLYLQGEGQPDPRSAQNLLTVGGAPEQAPAVANSQDTLTDYLRPIPVFIGSQLHGYALYAGRKSPGFSQLGLQSGDVLTYIDGTAVSDSSDSLTTLRTLTTGAALTVRIEREGVPQTLSLDGSTLVRLASTDPDVLRPSSLPSRDVTWSVTSPSLLTRENRP